MDVSSSDGIAADLPLHFTASVIRGSGRGQSLGIPTFNLDLSNVPARLPHGVYAGYVAFPEGRIAAAIHHGPRPVFNDTDSFEVHVLGPITHSPAALDVTVLRYLRTVSNFPSVDALMTQIDRDIAVTRAIMAEHESAA